MKHKLWNRVLAAVLAGVLCCSMLPSAAFAAEAPLDAASSTVIVEETAEEPAPTENAELPDATAPPTEDSAATPENAETAPSLSEAAQAFVDAVNALDRKNCLAKANAWGLAKRAADAEPDNAELAVAFETAIAEADEAAAPVYAADDLYAAVPEDERNAETVASAYTALAALLSAMQYAMENPTLTDADKPEPTADKMAAILYGDLPDAPTGSYLGSMGLPVATGDTKISIAAWNSDLTDESGAGRLDAAPLDEDNLTMIVAKQTGKEYAIVPISVQVEYPTNGSTATVALPEGVTLLSYQSTADGILAASEDEAADILSASFHEVAASASGFYVKTSEDFTATYTYTADGVSITKTLNVKVVDTADTLRGVPAAGSGTYAVSGPTPPFTSGVITKTQRGSTTWLIWFNGTEAYCCSHGLQGKVNGCPTYGYAYTSLLAPGQMQDTHEATQINIWGALGQLSLGMLTQQHTDSFAGSALYSGMSSTYSLADTELLEYCYKYYDDVQMYIIVNYPDSQAAQLYVNSAKAAMEAENTAAPYASSTGYYTWIYQPPISGWQTIALIGPPVGDEEIPDVPPVPQEYYADWSVGPQSASGSFDSSYTVNTDKIQLNTLEKVDSAVIEVEPIEKSGTIDGGNWAITPADKQTITTGGHTNDDNYQNNGGDASASWSLHYSVSKTTSGGKSGSVGPYTSQSAADDAASSAESDARRELQDEAQRMVDAAIAAAKAQLSTLSYRYDEITVPYGFDFYNGEYGSKQTITVPANSSNDYLMRNDEWSLQVNLKKTDSETGEAIAADAQFEVYEWDVVTQQYIPFGGYNQYKVERQTDGSYALINHSGYADTAEKQHNLYFTQRNEGKFVLVELQAPTGYYGDWTDLDHPCTVGTPLGKRAYYIEITKAKDGSVIWLDNSDYNADIATGYTGGTKLLTSGGVETTVTIGDYKDATRTYNTDNSGTAANEDSYTSTPQDGVFHNDRTLGEISLSKVDLDAARYVAGRDTDGNALASGQAHADAVLDGAVYDLYAAADITHPDGVTGLVDYSKILGADGQPIWHTTIRDNAGHWVSDYLPILAKDHLVASAEIKDGWLTFSNLYLGQYYIVERSAGVVIPVSDGAFVLSGTTPIIDAKTKQPTGAVNALAVSNGRYTDWVYRNQFSCIAQSKALDGTKTYDGLYISYAKGYLADEHNYYITPAYENEGWYVEKTAFADDRQADGEQRDTTAYSANYHIHRDNELAESDDQVMKGNVELSKVVSSTGSSDGIELEHAGFTFYLISDLSKEADFNTARSGAYLLNSILKAYLNPTYDESHLKYDFTGEGQAIAKTYEISAEEIAAYNMTLTEAGDYKNGVGDGWVAIGNPGEYQLAEIFSNDTGNIRVQGLPYGQYLVVETTTPKDVLQAEPFIVTIDPTSDTCPQSAMADPKDAVLTGSNSYQKFTVLDEEMEVYPRIVKLDEETGKAVRKEGTAFQIYWLDENGNYILNASGQPRLVTMAATQDGSVAKKVDTFYTNAEGSIALPEKLPLGHFRIVEVNGPEGFFNEWVSTTKYDENGVLLENKDGTWDTGEAYVDFTVTTDRIYQATGDDNEDSQDTLVIEETYSNRETLGKLTIRKLGEVLTGFAENGNATVIDPEYSGEAWPGDFTYAERPLAGAEYTITAAEDIYTQDNQVDANGNRTLWYAKGDVVAVVTTGNGTADWNAFAPARTDATYAFLSVIHDGTLGEVSVTLPLGSYHVEETKPPYGYVGTAQSYDVTFAWNEQTNEVVLAKTLVSHAEDGTDTAADFEISNESSASAADKEAQVLVYHNEREKARVGVYKLDEKTGEYLAGAVFNLYAADDIYNADGKLIFAAGDLVATSPETKSGGYTYFDVDVPIRGQYYGADWVHIPTESGFSSATNSGNYIIKEIRPPQGYFLNDAEMPVSFTYDGQVLQVLDSTCKNEATSMLISKRELTGDEELPGATLTIQDAQGNTVREWVSGNAPTEIRALHMNETYTLIETRPADGYALASNIEFRLVPK
ncbi:MAG: SpaA isopeptide-forming pilin-related protein, partial [Oscillospiraceae bacterium]|nr:SpaA isopeptide-forming pilin-related protein [Oscillospiraceae bacterium]